MAIAYSEFLQQIVAGITVPWQNVWVRLVSNNTGTAYVSDAVTSSLGKFTFATKPPGDTYTVYTGPSNTGPWTATGDASYAVPVVQGENPAFQSATPLPGAPFSPTTIPSVATLAGEAWAPPPNGVDDTTGLDAFYTAWASSGFKTKMKFWYGTYRYNGTGWNGSDYAIEGMSSHSTIIILGATSYLLTPTAKIASLEWRNMQLQQGLGGLYHTFTGNNVADQLIVENVKFFNYTQTAIGSCASDMPYWKIKKGIFYAANSTTAIGIALHGNLDQGSLGDCSFLLNAVHIKLDRGQNFQVENCDLIQFAAGTGRIKLWVVPGTSSGGNNGTGLFVRGTKFGNENADVSDYHVVYADEAAGTDFTTKLPNLGADSTGYIDEHTFENCSVFGPSGGGPVVYSTTPNLRGCKYGPFDIGGSAPSYLVQYRTVPLAPDRLNSRNLFAPLNFKDASELVSVPLSNAVGVGYIIDPQGVQLDNQAATNPTGGLDTTGYSLLLNTPTNSFTLGTMTKAPVTDSEGFGDAAEFTTTDNNSFALAGLTLGNIVIGDPVWIEFDLKQGSSASATKLTFLLAYSGGATHFQRILTLPPVWRRYRFLTYLRGNSPAFHFEFTTAGTATKFQVGRCACYHAREPIPYSALVRNNLKLGGQIMRSFQAPTEAVLVSGVTATAGEIVEVTLSAARVVGAPLNPAVGQRLTFTLIQGGAGAWAVTWNAVFKKTWADTGNATGARSSISFLYDGTNWNQDGAQAPYV